MRGCDKTDLVLVPALLDVFIADFDPRFDECLYQVCGLDAHQVSHLLSLCGKEFGDPLLNICSTDT